MSADEQRLVEEAVRKWERVEARAGQRSRLDRWLQACPTPIRAFVAVNPVAEWLHRLGRPEAAEEIEAQAALWFTILRRPGGAGRWTSALSKWMHRSPIHTQLIREMFELVAVFERQVTEEAARWFELFGRRLDRRRHRHAFHGWCSLSRMHVAAFLEITLLAADLEAVRRAALIDVEALLKR